MTNFRTQLFVTFIIVVAIALGVTIFAVLNATNKNIRIKANEELDIAQGVLNLLFEENNRTLTQKAEVLAKDYGFRDAIATQEEATIISALENHGERIDADMIILLNTKGTPIIGSHEINNNVLREIEYKLSHKNNSFSLLIIAEQQAFQTVIIPIKAPNIIAWVILGFPIDASLADKFKAITHSDIIFLYQENQTANSHLISTTGVMLTNTFNDKHNAETNYHAIRDFLTDNNWLLRDSKTISTDTQKFSTIMAISLDATLSAYQPLKIQMILVALLTLFLVGALTFLIAKQVTKPIDVLVAAAKRIASGQYKRTVKLEAKNEFGLLGNAINNMQKAIFERERHIKYQAETDITTLLPNQHTINQRLAKQLKSSQTSSLIGILSIKNYNSVLDIYGMQRCSGILKSVAEDLAKLIPDTASIGRIGDNEFVFYYPNTAYDTIDETMHTILSSLSPTFIQDDIEIKVEFAMGVVFAPEHGQTLTELMRRAHIALNKAIFNNQTYFVYQQGLDEKHIRQIQITQALQKAVFDEEFALCYQPKYDLKTDSIHQVEALIRWQKCKLGPVYPDEFIAIAEKTGIITKISSWVIDTVIEQLTHWNQSHPNLVISVNLSTQDILDETFLSNTFAKLETANIAPNRLMFEITESAMMQNPEQSIDNLKRIHQAGIKLSMDDFGTGYSSLEQLKLMPIHELKIDKSFVMNLDKSLDDQKIVELASSLGHHLGLSVVVEGVENHETLDILRTLECDAVQGYFISKPLFIDDLEALLLTSTKSNIVTLAQQGKV